MLFLVFQKFTPYFQAGTGFASEGYGMVNVRFRMCEPSHSGPMIKKRYHKMFASFESDLPIVADIYLSGSAKEAMYAGGERKQTMRFAFEDGYDPVEDGENVVQGRVGMNFTTNDVYAGMVVGPAFSVGYEPFKIKHLIAVYQEMKLAR